MIATVLSILHDPIMTYLSIKIFAVLVASMTIDDDRLYQNSNLILRSLINTVIHPTVLLCLSHKYHANGALLVPGHSLTRESRLKRGRISLCTVCAALTCCVLFTIISVMVMGVGIGYHYCFVQNSVEAMAKAAKAAGALRSGENEPGRQSHSGNVMRSVDKAVHRGFAHRLARREADSPLASNNLTLGNNFTDTNIINDFRNTDINNFTDTDINNFTDTHNLAVINDLTPLNLTMLNRLNTFNFTVF